MPIQSFDLFYIISFMKPIRFILLLTLFLGGYCQVARAQNLVPNPSFEGYHECPNAYSMFHTLDYWITPNTATTDYLNKCATGTDVGIPRNYFGNQGTRTGDAYAGFIPFEPGYNYREYLQVKLKQPLQAGETYQVEFYVSLSKVYNLPISNIGAYLSVEAPSSVQYGLLSNMTEAPQIHNPAGNLLTDTLWTKIHGAYTAKGGEQYLTIGNFDDDDHTIYLPTSPLPRFTYYYIDDVSVSNCPIQTDLGPDKVLCPGDTYTLDATSPGATYRWQDGSTLPTFQVNKAGTYWVDVKVATCSFRDSVRVSVLDGTYDILQDITLCPGTITTFNAFYKGATGYRWQDGSTQPFFSTLEPGVYWVDVQLAGCSFRDSVQVRGPVNKLQPLYQLCQGESTVLDARIEGGQEVTYYWSDGFYDPVRTVTEPGQYTVYINTNGCYFQQTVEVRHYRTGYPPIMYVCTGVTQSLNAYLPEALSYRWQDGSTNAQFDVSAPGTYWVEVRTAKCSFRDTIVVKYLGSNSLEGMKDVRLCPGSMAMLNAELPGALEYRWQDGNYGSSYYAYQPGIYWVDINLGSCTFRDSVTVSGPVYHLSPFYMKCKQEEEVLLDATVTEPATYLWSDGSTQPTLRVNQAGYYWVMVQTDNCSFYLSTQVSDFYHPEIFYEQETFICRGQQLVLNPNNYNYFNGPFLWQDGSTNATFLVDQPGLYWVEVLWNNCTIRDSIRVWTSDVSPPILPATLSLCAGQTYTLDASSVPGPYYWQDGSWQSAIQVTKPGTYWVEYYRNGCSAKSFTEVTYHPKPDIEFPDADPTLCYGQVRVLEVTGKNMAFRWQDGSTGNQYTIRKAGDYWVEGRDLTTGCTERKTYHIESVDCWTEFNIPNIITPNGDDANQYFVIEGITDHWGLEIFNRLGNRVYQTDAYANNWEARDQPVGLYYYHLRNPHSGQSYKGWLQVLR